MNMQALKNKAMTTQVVNVYELASPIYPALVTGELISVVGQTAEFLIHCPKNNSAYIGATIALKPCVTTVTLNHTDDIQDSMDYEIKSFEVEHNALAVAFDFDDVFCVNGLQFTLTEDQKTRLNVLIDEYSQAKFYDAKPHERGAMIVSSTMEL